jgi:hypothetical protein
LRQRPTLQGLFCEIYAESSNLGGRGTTVGNRC